MSVGHKSSASQMFRMMIYGRALHPELFELQARRLDRHGDYEVESWITTSGHHVRFHCAGEVLTEVVIDRGDHLPETGLIHALPCLGEKDYEMEPQGGLGYVSTIQTEQLTDNLYTATFREMQDFANETSSISREWTDDEGVTCLSVLDTQKYKHEFHLQSYHLLGSSGTVLRTQSIFEVLN